MKRIIYTLSALLTLVACDLFDYSLPGNYRGNRTTPYYGHSDSSRYSSIGPIQSQKPDTVIWVSGVCVPANYEWQKDTAMGIKDARLVLYRNDTLVYSLPIGPEYSLSPYPDSHHLLDGHIYSEFIGNGQTTLLCDGKPILTISGANYLKGLLQKDGSIYTLYSNPAKGNHTFRQNDNLLLSLTAGYIPGGFEENSPALYQDKDHIYFSFIDGNSINLIEDGILKPVAMPSNTAKVYDCRVFDGSYYLAYTQGKELKYSRGNKNYHVYSVTGWDEDFCLFRYGNDIVLCASNSADGHITYACLLGQQVEIAKFDNNNLLFYKYQGRLIGINKRPLLLYNARPIASSNMKPFYTCNDAFVFTKSCVQVFNGRLYVALSPEGKEGAPYLLRDGKKMVEYPFNGYLTGLHLELVTPNLGDETHQIAQ